MRPVRTSTRYLGRMMGCRRLPKNPQSFTAFSKSPHSLTSGLDGARDFHTPGFRETLPFGVRGTATSRPSPAWISSMIRIRYPSSFLFDLLGVPVFFETTGFPWRSNLKMPG